MMNKLTLISVITALSCCSLVQAGSMGNEITNAGFIALEGGYSVNSIKNFDFAFLGANTTLTSIKSNQNYAGRIGAGMLFMMDEQCAVTSELGWGYYGRTTLKPATGILDNLTIKYTISGFDALIGIAYINPNFTLSLKGGALIQNMQVQTNAVLNDMVIFDNTSSFTSKQVQTAALPEIKIGAAYNIDSNWAITGAYVFAAGSSPRTTGAINVNTLNSFFLTNTQNTTLNVGFLGIQYTC